MASSAMTAAIPMTIPSTVNALRMRLAAIPCQATLTNSRMSIYKSSVAFIARRLRAADGRSMARPYKRSFTESARNAGLAFGTTGDAAAMGELAVVGVTELFELFFVEADENSVSVFQTVEYLCLGSAGGTNSHQGELRLALLILHEHPCFAVIGCYAGRRDQQDIVLS